jgi:CheY-like chemotaxis protein
MGHRVTCAADGEAAVDCAAGRRVDLILMDMQMPGRDGLSATAAIRAGAGPNAATPIIALTADAAMERRPLCESGGIGAVLTKPIDSRA